MSALRRSVARGAVLLAAVGALAVGGVGPLPAAAIASPAATSSAAWTVVTSPNPSSKASLSGVSCFTAGACWAVGVEGGSGGAEVPFTEETSGTGWSLISSPEVGGALQAVSCVSSAACEAVGVQASTTVWGATLVERYATGGWSVVSTPATSSGNGDLTGVACVSTSDCWAVGAQVTSSNGAIRAPLVEHYNGSSWSIATAANADGGLSAVTCVSASDCWAAGYQTVAGNQTGLVERYTGASWSVVSSPTVSAYLDSVACLNASACSAGGKDVLEQWNGTAWQVAAQPSGVLLGMACASAAAECWAVGGSTDVLVEEYAGGAWTVTAGVTNPQPTGFSFAELEAVACGDSSECVAVGSTNESSSGASSGQTLVEDHAVAPGSATAAPAPTPTPSASATVTPTATPAASASASPTSAPTTSTGGSFPWALLLVVCVVVVAAAAGGRLGIRRRTARR
jgi:hypothetical protein